MLGNIAFGCMFALVLAAAPAKANWAATHWNMRSGQAAMVMKLTTVSTAQRIRIMRGDYATPEAKFTAFLKFDSDDKLFEVRLDQVSGDCVAYEKRLESKLGKPMPGEASSQSIPETTSGVGWYGNEKNKADTIWFSNLNGKCTVDWNQYMPLPD